MDSIICPTCSEESYICRIGKIGVWEWWQCDACDNRHWRWLGGVTKKQADELAKGALYAAMERDRQKREGKQNEQ